MSVIICHPLQWSHRNIISSQIISNSTVCSTICSGSIILCMCRANERQRYIATSSAVGRAHAQNDPCSGFHRRKSKLSMVPPVGHLNINMPFYQYIEIPMLKIRRSCNRLIFNMGIPVPGKMVFILRQGPWYQLSCPWGCRWIILHSS